MQHSKLWKSKFSAAKHRESSAVKHIDLFWRLRSAHAQIQPFKTSHLRACTTYAEHVILLNPRLTFINELSRLFAQLRAQLVQRKYYFSREQKKNSASAEKVLQKHERKSMLKQDAATPSKVRDISFHAYQMRSPREFDKNIKFLFGRTPADKEFLSWRL